MTTTKEEPKPENASILTQISEDRSQGTTFVLPKPKFRYFNNQSYTDLVEREEEDKQKARAKKNKPQEAHLVDGELKFDEDDPHEKKLTRDPYLAEGQSLPDSFGIFPSTHFGKPLEEIDPYIKDKTFIVIAKRFKKKFIYRFSATPSFFFFSPWNPIRRLAVRIATNQIFDYFVILTILINCVFLAMPDEPFTETSEYVFLAIYMLEMIIKLIARGFIINSYTYLRDPWNWLDFIVIVMAVITLIIQATESGEGAIGNLTGLRTFRVLRALKTVSIVPGLKTIVNALLRAFKMLIEVITLTLFCLMIFALFALQVYMGTLRQKCVANLPVYVETPSKSYGVFYSEFTKNTSNWLTVDDEYVLCGNLSGSGKCPTNYTCLPGIGENPNFGYTNFDHFGWAMLNAFQLITLDFWEDCYNKVLRTSGPWNIVFFLIVIFFGSFYLINLMLAVVAMSYEEESEFAGKEKEREKALKKKHNPMYDLAVLTVAKNKLKDKVKETSDSTKPNSILSSITEEKNGSPLIPRNPDKPLLKKQSKDSGFSSRSQTSTKSNPRLLKDDSQELLSMPEFSEEEKKAAKDEKGTVNKAFVPDNDNNVKDKNQKTMDRLDSDENVLHAKDASKKSAQPKGKIAPKGEKPNFVIITAEDEDPDSTQDSTHLVDRNYKCCKKGCVCYVPWLRFQNSLYTYVSDPVFDLFITFCIIVNTCLMGSEHYNMPAALGEALKVSNYVFTFVFTLEAVLKICALGKFYFKSGWNVFDLVIVIASLIDLGLEDIDGLSVFRTFRLLRVFKLAQNWPTLRLLLTIIINTLGALGNLSVILIIIIYIFAVIGLQLFNKSYTVEKFAPDPVPRWNFNDFFHSLMLVFRILCGEWIEPMWDCMKVENELCMVVFLPSLILGNFIVLNLFLAMLLNSFASGSMRKHKDTIEANKFKIVWERIKKYCCCCLPKNIIAPSSSKEDTKDSGDGDNSKPTAANGVPIPKGLPKPKNAAKINWKRYAAQGSTTTEENSDRKESISITEWSVKQTFLTNRDQYSKFTDGKAKQAGPQDKKTLSTSASKDKDIEDPDDIKMGDTASEHEPADAELIVHDCLPICMSKRLKWYQEMDEKQWGKRWKKFRAFMTFLVSHKIFEGIVLSVIFASSLTLAFEDVYLYSNQATQDALYYLNIIFCVLFTIEMFMKWFAYGLKKYFTEFWTILDFFIVVISISSLVAQSLGIDNLSAFRSLRTLRALRPLRAVSRWEGMKIVVNALMMAIPAIFNVLLVCLIFWLIFSIMGVQFFAGKFYRCIDSDGEMLSDTIVKNKTDCIAQNYTWQNTEINFDDVLNGYLALLQVATFEGWMEVMASAVDSTEIDQQPSFEASLYSYLYFLAFIVFGSFFTLNLFIGVIIDQFNVLKKKYDGSYLDMFLTPTQKNYYNTMKKLGNKKPQKTVRRPKNRFLSIFFDVGTSNKFELLIVSFIFLNMIVMAVEHYNQSDTITEVLDITNMIFTTVFTLEAIVKLIGLRWHYFRQPWNVFDFIVVLLSIIGIILDDILSNVFVTPTLLRVVRIFRIGRVLRLIKAAKGIRKLLFALIISLPALFNIGALLFLVMFIFAIIGMSSFGHLKLQGFLNDIVNFRTFGSTFLLLVRLSTSAGWNDILEPMLIQPPYCNDTHWQLPSGEWREDSGGECGTKWLAIGWMVSFILISYLIVINMYIAVILENFQQAHEQEEVGITEDDFDMFYAVWERYDPLATQYIKYDQLTEFVSDLDEPLGIPKPNEIALVSFNLPIVEGDKLHCLDVLMGLVKCVLGDVEETEAFKELRAQMELKFHDAFPTRVKTTVLSSTMQRKKEDVAAKTLQRSWRRHKTQKQLKNITALAMQRSHTKQAGASASRANSIMSLGRRLSNALSVFFSSSRPSSALSRLSVKSTFSSNDVSPKMKKKKPKSTPNMPKMAVLYPNLAHDEDLNL